MEYVELNNGVKMPLLGYGVCSVMECTRLRRKRQSAVCLMP